MIIYIGCTYLHYKTIYLFSTAYILCLSIFHLGYVFQLAAGSEISSGISVGSFTKLLENAGWHVVLSLAAMGMGIGLSSFSSRKKIVTEAQAEKIKKKAYAIGRWSAIGLLLASLIFFIMAVSSYGNILNYARHDLFRSGADSRGFGVFMMIFPGAVSLLLLTASNKKQMLIGFCFCGFAFLLFMFSGYRSAALFSALTAVIVWVKSGRKLPTWIAVTSIVFVMFAITFSGYLRGMGAYGEIDTKKLSKSYEQSSVTEGVAHLGQTLGLLGHVLKLVPDKDPYRYGGSYLTSIRNSIPNIGFSMNVSSGRQAAKNAAITNKYAISEMAPSDWLTYRILRDQFDLGQGVGFTGIGEPYLNFGVSGVIAYFLLLGFLLGKLDHKNIAYYPFIYVFCCSMLWPLMQTVRNDMSNFIKPVMFMLIILSLWSVVGAVFLKNKLK